MVTIAGDAERVHEAFLAAHADSEGGAQLCVYRHGNCVLDCATGRDVVTERPYTPDTLTVLMSCTKAAVAMCVHLLAERGAIDLDAAVARYWPDFAANGKEDVRVRHLLAHSSGLFGFDPAAGIDAQALLDWDVCTKALERMAPLWSPGTAYGYHFVTYGYLVGELVHRTTGMSVGAFFREAIGEPFGIDLWIGLPEVEEARVAPHFRSTPPISRAEWRARLGALGIDSDHPVVHALIETIGVTEELIDLMTTRPGRAAEIPAGNGVGTAHGLARLYAACIGPLDGARLLSEATVRRAREPQTDELTGPPPLSILSGGSPQRFALGFELPREIMPMLGEGSFGHPGAGGRLGFAHPELGIAVGYACNALVWDGVTPDPRWGWCEVLRETVLD